MKNPIYILRIALISLFLLPISVRISISQQAGPAPPEFLVTTPSNYDFDDTVNILKGAIEEQNLMVVLEIDAQRMLRMVDVQSGGMTQILFFHPRYMKRIIAANRNAGIAPPLKVVVVETPNGKVMVRYEQPEHLFEAYEGLSEIAAELDAVVRTIVAEVNS
ncbi:MAG: hypothetical protein BMS9Abin05_0007 [Rhodothermia bacterium]|nr:MAG: hypothetical protein BMS9Abin05_0007 [Rhodothermia bacterium]